MRKFLFLCLISVFCFAVSGCETMQTSAHDAWQKVKCADNWVKKTLW
jgi:hypothetical protein